MWRLASLSLLSNQGGNARPENGQACRLWNRVRGHEFEVRRRRPILRNQGREKERIVGGVECRRAAPGNHVRCRARGPKQDSKAVGNRSERWPVMPARSPTQVRPRTCCGGNRHVEVAEGRSAARNISKDDPSPALARGEASHRRVDAQGHVVLKKASKARLRVTQIEARSVCKCNDAKAECN